MRFRCEEGDGECIYNIGVEDDGIITGITLEEYNETLRVLNSMAEKNCYDVTLLASTLVDETKMMYEVLVRENNEDKYIDVKVAVAGNVDCGKSSLISVLTSGVLDNGRGSARVSVFNFPHEIKTGRTSSVGHHIMGFDTDGKEITYNGINGKLSWPDIVKRSVKR
jgi:GTPase